MSFQRILIALDDSPISIQAMEVGRDFAKAVGAEIALLHVLDPRIAYAPEGGFPLQTYSTNSVSKDGDFCDARHGESAAILHLGNI